VWGIAPRGEHRRDRTRIREADKLVKPGRHGTRARTRRSLLARMALAFGGAIALTALALALAAYYVTKTVQDSRALDAALEQSRQNLIVADAMLPPDPAPSDYEALMPAFQIRGDFETLVETRPQTYVSGPTVTRTPITDDLAAAVAGGRIRYQIVDVAGEPIIVVGSQLRAGELTIYFFFPQGARLAELTDLRNILIAAGTALAVLGAIAGYLLARRLLRPIREASAAAEHMSLGDLAIRLPVGSDEFGALAASFNRMAANLQAEMLDLEAGQARERRFVADVTHELRTPITALVGEASLLKARLDSPVSGCSAEIKRLAELVTHDVARLRQLVDDLLEIGRLEAQAAETAVEPVEIAPFLARLLEAHGWAEAVHLADPAPTPPLGKAALSVEGLMVLADKRRLERILVNLIDNALQHGAPPVLIEYRPEGAQTAQTAASPGAPPYRLVAVSVRDHGPGIPIEHLPHIFDRFYKADPSRSSSRGSGLGLAIARENARLLGGDIAATNVPDGGARLVVTLRAADL
jgi:signal transduction histidine kinase